MGDDYDDDYADDDDDCDDDDDDDDGGDDSDGVDDAWNDKVDIINMWATWTLQERPESSDTHGHLTSRLEMPENDT